jgi:hypothetical protein
LPEAQSASEPLNTLEYPSRSTSSSLPTTPPDRPVSPERAPFQNPYVSKDTTYGSAAASINASPYRPSNEVRPIASYGTVQIVQRPIEDVLKTTFSIFGSRWSALVMGSLIILLAFIVLYILGAIAVAMAAALELPEVVGLLIILLLPLLIILTGYAWAALTRLSLFVARDVPEPLSQLIPPFAVVARFLIAGAVMALVSVLVLLVLGLFSVVISSIDQGIGGITMILGVIAIFMGVILLQFLIWPIPYVLADSKISVMSAFSTSAKIALHNKATSILLIILSFVLSTVGSSLCYVGQIVTFPLTLLMFAVAYLMLTNQTVSDPKEPTPSDTE